MSTKKIAAIIGLCVAFLCLAITGTGVLTMVPRVQAELSRTPTPTPLSGNVMRVTPDPNATKAPASLKYGSQGSEVSRLQQRLKDLGYYSGQVDGKFGNGTRTALKQFQQQHGLTADGILGSRTSALLYSDEAQVCSGSSKKATPTPKPASTAVPSSKSRSYIRADGLPLLVNASNPLPSDYVNFDLVCLNDYCDPSVVKIKYKDTWAEREAADALLVMLKAAQADGLKTWQISSAYRTV